jgi:hypothetical protein
MYTPQIVTGTVAGTGSAINVSLAFVPTYVKAVNIGGAVTCEIEWFKGMAAAKGLKTVEIADNGSTTKKAGEYIASAGITVNEGSQAVTRGFTIGADADLNVNGETIAYMAIGGGL